MSRQNPTAIVNDLLINEGIYLDDHRWQEWLELYAIDAVYWIPVWLSEHAETNDPDSQISQIYHDSRRGLEERVTRVESGKSVTALPLPRTTHFFSNLVAEKQASNLITARASWMTQVYEPRTTKRYVNFGHYELQLKRPQSTWLIAQKKIHLKNDCVPTMIDFYTV
jgi:3-phenylpropionate/cinnamic acid dioxygenase small subunit